jgi:hypothetical protein
MRDRSRRHKFSRRTYFWPIPICIPPDRVVVRIPGVKRPHCIHLGFVAGRLPTRSTIAIERRNRVDIHPLAGRCLLRFHPLPHQRPSALLIRLSWRVPKRMIVSHSSPPISHRTFGVGLNDFESARQYQKL